MSELFLISDTHFGHKKILEFEKESRIFSSIEEHDEALISNWNRVVGKKDVIWHLGDVLFGASSFSVLPRLNGIKRLILGNHDSYPSSRYLEFFNSLHGSAEIRDYLLTHIPVHESQFRRAKGNIHGHLHSRSIGDDRYINVSADRINLTPIAFDSLPPAGSP
jgi:calcineurin-like phosphoesterase family protein